MNDSWLPLSPSGAGLFMVVNPASGRTRCHPDAGEILSRNLPEAIVHTLASGEDIREVLRESVASDVPPFILGVCGGDGSVVAAAEVAFGAQLPLLVLPGGTFNHFAITIGITDFRSGISALQRGAGVPVDLAEIDFGDGSVSFALNTLSVGVYPDFVQYRTKIETRLGRPIATVVAALRAAMSAAPLEVTLDGRKGPIWSIFIGVGQFAPPRGAPMKRLGFADGILDVRILRSSLRTRGRGFFTLLGIRRRPRHDVDADPMLRIPQHALVSTRTSITLETTGRGGEVFAHDGEVHNAPRYAVAGVREVTVRIIPAALRIYSPMNLPVDDPTSSGTTTDP